MKKQASKTSDLPEILTLEQARKLLNVHSNTLRNWDNKGILKAIRYGSRGDRRYKKKEVLKFLNPENL